MDMDNEIEFDDTPTYRFYELSEKAKEKALENIKKRFTLRDNWSDNIGSIFSFNAGLIGLKVTHIHHVGLGRDDQGTAFYGSFTTDNDLSTEELGFYLLGNDEEVEKYKGFFSEIKQICGDAVISGRINGSGELPNKKQNMAFDYSEELEEGDIQKAASLLKVYHKVADMLHEELIEAKSRSKTEAEMIEGLESGELKQYFLEDGELY